MLNTLFSPYWQKSRRDKRVWTENRNSSRSAGDELLGVKSPRDGPGNERGKNRFLKSFPKEGTRGEKVKAKIKVCKINRKAAM